MMTITEEEASEFELRKDGVRAAFQLILASWSTQRQRMSDLEIEAMAEAYTAGMIDLEPSVLRAAVVRLAQTTKWLPTIAEIREAATWVKFGHRTTGTEAWGEVHKKMSRYGAYRVPGEDFTFDDPLAARIVDMLGWNKLCVAGPVDLTSARARFIDTYEEIKDNELKDAATRPGIQLEAGDQERIGHARRIPAARKPVLSATERSAFTRQVLIDVIDKTGDPNLKAMAAALPTLALPAVTCSCAAGAPGDLGVAEDGRCRHCGAPRKDPIDG